MQQQEVRASWVFACPKSPSFSLQSSQFEQEPLMFTTTGEISLHAQSQKWNFLDSVLFMPLVLFSLIWFYLQEYVVPVRMGHTSSRVSMDSTKIILWICLLGNNIFQIITLRSKLYFSCCTQFYEQPIG